MTASADAFAGCKFRRPNSRTITFRITKTHSIARRVGERMGKTVETETPLMLGDDFADYGRIAPYCYAQVGIADEDKGTHYAHHNGRFKVDEDVLWKGAAWMAAFAAEAGESWN